MKILIVDDSRSSRMMVKSCLKEIVAEIHEADGGEMAVNKFKAEKFDLVIMDIHMPRVDGYEAMKGIRAFEVQHEATAVPIIALTAMDPAQAEARTKDAGATRCLSKPVKQTVLLEAIYAICPFSKNAASRPAAAPEKPPEASGRFKKLFGLGKEQPLDGMAYDGLRDQRPAFITEKQEEVRAATLALDGGSLEMVRVLAHRLKGEGANFGFSEITDLGATLIGAIERWDTRTARATLQKLQTFLTKAAERPAA